MKSLCMLFILLSSLPGYSQDHERREGSWWLSHSQTAKAEYVVGFFDGINIGERASGYKLSETDKSCRDKAKAAGDAFTSKYLAHVTDRQLVDGLDAFYKDPRNRSILVTSATVPVLRQIAGDPADVVKAETEALRNHSKNE